MGLEGLNPVFGKVFAEANRTAGKPIPFVFQVCGVGDELRVIASDFVSNTYQAMLSGAQLEDLRDDIGISGSWSDFLDYLATSLSSDVKLIIGDVVESEGASCSRIVSQKAKGLPKISIRLEKLVGAVAAEVNAILALELYSEFINTRHSLVEEQRSKDQLLKLVDAKEEKCSILTQQLPMLMSPRKRQSMNITSTGDSDSSSIIASQDSPDKNAHGSPNVKRVTNRVVPAHRRSKLRGAVLDYTEDEQG